MDEELLKGLVSYAKLLGEEVNNDPENEETTTHARYMEALKQIQEFDKLAAESHDRDEKLRIEEKKNDAAAEIELKKQELSWKRIAFELAKVGIPVLGGVISLFAGLSMAYDVEKEGRVNTKFSNIVLNQMPKIWNGK